MGWQIHTWSMSAPSNWQEAKRYFDGVQQPRGRAWGENERPLRDNRAHHLRVEKNSDDSYSMILYRTAMVRFCPPDADGNERVDLSDGGSTVSSNAFNWRFGYHSRMMLDTDDGRRVMLPTLHIAKLVFSPQQRLITSLSEHAQMYVVRSGPEARRRRAQFREALQPIVDMIPYKLQELEENVEEPTTWERTHFVGVNAPYQLRDQLQHAWWDAGNERELSQQSYTALLEVLPYVYKALVWRQLAYVEESTPTAQQVEASFVRWATKAAGLDRGDEKKFLPMWQEHYPKTAAY
jgi:hypothetical protein